MTTLCRPCTGAKGSAVHMYPHYSNVFDQFDRGDEYAEDNTGSMELDSTSVTTANSDNFEAIHGTTRSLTTRVKTLEKSRSLTTLYGNTRENTESDNTCARSCSVELDQQRWENTLEDHELNFEDVLEPTILRLRRCEVGTCGKQPRAQRAQ